MNYCTVAPVITDEKGNPIQGASVTLSPDRCGVTNSDGYIAFNNIPNPSVVILTVKASGYKDYQGDYAIDGNTNLPVALESSIPIFNPTRNDIIHVNQNLCNLRDNDDWPIFDPFIDWLIFNNPGKAKDWITRLIDAGSTHVNIDISGDYNENLGWAPRYPVPGTDWTNQLDKFQEILDWILGYKLIPHVHLASDGQRFDPNGMTYGWQWGMSNLPTILPKLSNYTKKCLWNGGWDGCFPDWSPEQFIQFYNMLRTVLGNDAQLAAEFGGPQGATIGYCHLGNGAADWNGPLQVLDVFCTELQVYPCPPEGIAQTATRLLGPGAKNCPTSPYYIPANRPRGELGISYWETVAYWAVRKYVTPHDAQLSAQQGQFYGFKNFGNGLP